MLVNLHISWTGNCLGITTVIHICHIFALFIFYLNLLIRNINNVVNSQGINPSEWYEQIETLTCQPRYKNQALLNE